MQVDSTQSKPQAKENHRHEQFCDPVFPSVRHVRECTKIAHMITHIHVILGHHIDLIYPLYPGCKENTFLLNLCK